MKKQNEVARMQQLAGIKPLNESFDSLVHKLEKQGKSEKAAEKIAGAINAKYVHHYKEGVEEVDEIKVNEPGKIQFDYSEEDDDGELKIISLSKDGEEWWGNENYTEEPGFLKMEFLFEEGEDNTYEQENMDKLTSLLNKNNIPYEITGDKELKFVKIPKDKLELR